MPAFPNRCQHIKVNGTQCGCPALRRNKLCYFHKRHHEERIALNADRARHTRSASRQIMIDMPVLEDANSIQVALMQIMRLIISGRLEGKTAGFLLYALQTASANLRHTRFEPLVHDVVLDPKTVGGTPIGGSVWEDEDFITEEEEEAEALAEAQRRATREAEAEAKVNRIIEEGRRERAAGRERERRLAAQTGRPYDEEDSDYAEPPPIQRVTGLVTPDGRAIIPPEKSVQPPAKRPPAKADINEVREQVTAQIKKALPAIAAALNKQNGARTG